MHCFGTLSDFLPKTWTNHYLLLKPVEEVFLGDIWTWIAVLWRKPTMLRRSIGSINKTDWNCCGLQKFSWLMNYKKKIRNVKTGFFHPVRSKVFNPRCPSSPPPHEWNQSLTHRGFLSGRCSPAGLAPDPKSNPGGDCQKLVYPSGDASSRNRSILFAGPGSNPFHLISVAFIACWMLSLDFTISYKGSTIDL